MIWVLCLIIVQQQPFDEFLIKSIFAGVMIGIAGTVFLRVDNNIIGSFL